MTVTLEEQITQRDASLELLTERIAELELALEDVGWQRALFEGGQDFSAEGRARIRQMSRLYYLKNPLIQRAVNVQAFYTWGQGVAVRSDQEAVDAVLQRFLGDTGNRDVLFGHQAQLLADIDLAVEGDLFFALFVSARTGRVQVRVIDAGEIVEIHTNPHDRTEPWWYERHWNEGLDAKTGLYRHWRYTPSSTDARPERVPEAADVVILHVRSGGLRSMKFGVPETYAALDWARAYKEFLENWASLVKSLSRFAWRVTTKQNKLAAAKSKLASTLTPAQSETNPLPPAGSAFISDDQASITPIPKTGATTSAEDGKQLRLMVAAAMNIPDTILSGDVDQGNLATAKTLDRPTELAFRSRQQIWADVLQDLCTIVVRAAVRASVIAGAVEVDEDGIERVLVEGEAPTVEVVFPPILEADAGTSVSAIVAAAPFVPAEFVARQLLVVLGADNVEELIEQLGQERDDASAAGIATETVEALRMVLAEARPG